MLRTGIITAYPRLRLLVISEFISSNRREKLSARAVESEDSPGMDR